MRTSNLCRPPRSLSIPDITICLPAFLFQAFRTCIAPVGEKICCAKSSDLLTGSRKIIKVYIQFSPAWIYSAVVIDVEHVSTPSYSAGMV